MSTVKSKILMVCFAWLFSSLVWAIDEPTVNVNKADAATIAQVLDGIGPKRAEAIVKWREAHGEFSTLDSMERVKGVGEDTLLKNRERIRLKD